MYLALILLSRSLLRRTATSGSREGRKRHSMGKSREMPGHREETDTRDREGCREDREPGTVQTTLADKRDGVKKHTQILNRRP